MNDGICLDVIQKFGLNLTQVDAREFSVCNSIGVSIWSIAQESPLFVAWGVGKHQVVALFKYCALKNYLDFRNLNQTHITPTPHHTTTPMTTQSWQR